MTLAQAGVCIGHAAVDASAYHCITRSIRASSKQLQAPTDAASGKALLKKDKQSAVLYCSVPTGLTHSVAFCPACPVHAA